MKPDALLGSIPMNLADLHQAELVFGEDAVDLLEQVVTVIASDGTGDAIAKLLR